MYPPYLSGLIDTEYCFSDVEFIAMCKCRRTNVVISKRHVENALTMYLRSCIVDPSKTPMLSVFQVSRQHAVVRSHFAVARNHTRSDPLMSLTDTSTSMDGVKDASAIGGSKI